MRVSDQLANCLVKNNIKHVFMLTGGGAMHLNDALSRKKDISVVHFHHEQACAMAAEAYARMTGKIAVVNVTTGPGGINTLNGVFGAWTDSVPMLIISGQVKTQTMMTKEMKLRQLGDQEASVVEMTQCITKESFVVNDSRLADDCFQKAIDLAYSGRPGPVWLDIPIDIQNAPYNQEDQVVLDKGLFLDQELTTQYNQLDFDLIYKKLMECFTPMIIF